MDATGESQVPLISERPAHQIRRKRVGSAWPEQPNPGSFFSTAANTDFAKSNEIYPLSYIPLPSSYHDPRNVVPDPPVSGGRPNIPQRSWRPGFWIQFPIIGILALVLSALCTVAAVVVLVYSNGMLVSELSGNLQPSVLLAYTSTLANLFLGAALSEGLVIAFWNLAINGASILDLQYSWIAGYSLWGGFKALWHFKAKTVSLACILTTISCILRGPLMQRATIVQSRVLSRNDTLQVHIAPTIGDSFGGQVQGRSSSDITFSPNFTAVVQNFQNREAIVMPSASCDNCTLNVTGFGFGVNCVRTSQPFNLTIPNPNSTDFQRVNQGYTIFSTSVLLVSTLSAVSNYGLLVVNVTRKDSQACEGTLAIQTCSLSPGTASYAIKMDGNIVSFQSSSWKDDTFLRSTNMSLPRFGSNTLGPLQIFGSALFTSTSHLSFGGATGYILGNTALLSNLYLDATPNDCNVSFRDPMDDIINAYRELAVRMAIRAAMDNSSISDTVPYASKTTQVIYVVNFTNLSVAVVISALGLIAVVPLFAGWWALGRKMSTSPLELANAFGGAIHIFSALNGNATSEDILRRFKKGSGNGESARLKYGVLTNTGRLALGDEGIVRRPNPGEYL